MNMRVTLSLSAMVLLAMTVVLSPAAAQQTIMIDGSTGTAPLVAALGKSFTAKTGIAVAIGKGLGTRARFDALAGGTIDIAMASHGLNVAAVTGKGMTVHRIAMTPVVFGVHDSVSVQGLADAQVCAIYSGEARNWKALGGNDLAIAALVRPETEVDMEVVRDGVPCFKNLKLRNDAQAFERAGDMAKALAATTGSVGMTSATVVAQSGGRIKALALNGVAASEAAVAGGQYRLTRDAFLVTAKTSPAAAKAFVEFVRSADGAAVIKANGAIAATR